MDLPLFLAVGPFGPTELLVVLFIVVLLFGAKKLPELAKGLGKAKNEFQKAASETEDAAKATPPAPESRTPPPPASTPSNN